MDHLLPQTLSAFAGLCAAAQPLGFGPQIESGYRSFERQLDIWNRKARGELPVRGTDEIPLDIHKLSRTELVKAILLWSMLPGASRHHWGTDLDVVDACAMPPGYEAQLTAQEAEGIFAPFHHWLDGNLERFGFRRVYKPGLGRTQPERWHLSFVPESQKMEQKFRLKNLQKQIEKADIELKTEILDLLPWIAENHIFPYFLQNCK